jgi:hypothetical protein
LLLRDEANGTPISADAVFVYHVKGATRTQVAMSPQLPGVRGNDGGEPERLKHATTRKESTATAST